MLFLGLYLGHKLLTESLGGKCGLSVGPESGIFPVQHTQSGEDKNFFLNFPSLLDACSGTELR